MNKLAFVMVVIGMETGTYEAPLHSLMECGFGIDTSTDTGAKKVVQRQLSGSLLSNLHLDLHQPENATSTRGPTLFPNGHRANNAWMGHRLPFEMSQIPV